LILHPAVDSSHEPVYSTSAAKELCRPLHNSGLPSLVFSIHACDHNAMPERIARKYAHCVANFVRFVLMDTTMRLNLNQRSESFCPESWTKWFRHPCDILAMKTVSIRRIMAVTPPHFVSFCNKVIPGSV